MIQKHNIKILIFSSIIFLSCGKKENEMTVNYFDHLFNKIENSSGVSDRQAQFTNCLFKKIDDVEFTCNRCSRKTNYSFYPYMDENKLKIDQYSDILYEESFDRLILELREEFKKHHISADIDKNSFCPHCNGKNERHFSLQLHYPDGSTVTSPLYEPNDLVKLTAFLSGKTTWIDFPNNERPLKSQIPIIKRLLGIEPISANNTDYPERTPERKYAISKLDLKNKLISERGNDSNIKY